MTLEHQYDCVVVGGGPAGATAATILAQYGRRTAVVEREQFPRYHVGESLMPYTWFTFKRLGVLDWFEEAACPKKYSVQFVSTTGEVSQPFYFFETIKHECSTTWQVRRNDFDRMLLDNAQAKGASIHQGVTIREPIMHGTKVAGVRGTMADGAPAIFHADAVIDASGTHFSRRNSVGRNVTRTSIKLPSLAITKGRHETRDSTKVPQRLRMSLKKVGFGTFRSQTTPSA